MESVGFNSRFKNLWGGRSQQVTKETKSFTLIEHPPGRSKVDIQSWKNAIQAAESIGRPTRVDIYNLYIEQLDFDAHMNGIIEKRMLNILNKVVSFVDDKGEAVEAVADFISNPIFDEFQRDALGTKFWGYSLFEFDYSKLFNYDLIPRKHVHPELGTVTKDQYGTGGFPYIGSDIEKYVLPFGKDKDLGILKTAIYYSILKRNTFGDWGNYVELAGNNFELIKYSGNDMMLKNATENAMKKSGSNGQVAVPDGVEVDFVNKSSTSQNDLFEGFKNTLNAEQSKLILGQTMTTEDGSSRSQAEVHEEQQNEIFFADELYILNFLNYNFKPYLTNWGLPDTGKFIFEKQETRAQQIAEDKALMDIGIVWTDQELREKYNID